MSALRESKAYQYVESKSWNYRATEDHLILETCPICGRDGWKFYIRFSPSDKDGMWDDKVCGESGNLYQLREFLGDRLNNVTSMSDVAASGRQASPLPDVEAAHRRLMKEAEEAEADITLEYLVGERGYSMAVIEKYKLGIVQDFGKKWLVIPYFHKDNLVYAKFRTLPPEKKEFRGVSGREATLFNEDALTEGIEELMFVEGEGDCLSCLSNGIENVVGIPGANMKKLAWMKKLDDVNPKKIYLLYDNDKVGQDAAKEMAKRIGIQKCYNIVLPKAVGDTEIKDINEFFVAGGTLEAFETLKAQAKPFSIEGVQGLSEIVAELKEDLLGGGSLEPTWTTQYPSVNAHIGGFEEGDLVGIMGEAKCGKAQPLTAKVLTPYGWVEMGDLRVGDEVCSVDGKPSKVIGVFPQGVKDAHRVTFSDGRSTVACGEHLWQVGDSGNFTRDGYQTLTTNQIAKQRSSKWFVPLWAGHIGHSRSLLMDPWLLGALIGDGGFTNGTPVVTKTDQLFLTEVAKKVGWDDCRLVRIDDVSYRISRNGEGPNKIKEVLQVLGLYGKLSYDKFIPQEYKLAGREHRLALLHGLMDSDGSVDNRRYASPSFGTSSLQLALDVQELVWSLGGTANISSRIPTFTYKGEKKKGRRAYRVSVRLHDPVFMHSEKANRESVRSRNFRLTISSIEQTTPCEMQCIAVSHPSHLYITDDYIVAHNTSWALNILDSLVERYKLPALFYCQEMNPKRVIRKWIAYVTDTDDENIVVDTVDAALNIACEREADYLFAYTPRAKAADVFETIRQTVRRYGVKFVCFDNLQVLCRAIQNNSQETASVCQGFKDLAMELGIVIFLIIQPNRVGEGEVISSRNAMGSSAIEKIVDTMLCTHRNREGKVKQADLEVLGFIEVNENFTPPFYVRADLTRYASGGTTTLWLDGAKSKVTEFSEENRRKANALVPLNDVIAQREAA